MSYADKDDIKSMFRDFADNADAAVDDADLDRFLKNTTSTINAKVGTLYVLPILEIPSPEAYAILKQLQMFKVAAIVDEILNSYRDGDKKPMWWKSAKMLMEEIVPDKDPKSCVQCVPTMILPDATFLGTSVTRNKIKISSTNSTIFKKGEDNW